MNYLQDLTEEELKYICSEIPYHEAFVYFKAYPKEFTKIRPGFRVKALKPNNVAKILYDFRKRDYIAQFIVKHIDRWIKEIGEEISIKLQEGLDTETAYIDVLSRSHFVHNIPLYFKIMEEEKAKDYIIVLSAAVKYQLDRIVSFEKEREEFRKALENRDKENALSQQNMDVSAKTIAKLKNQDQKRKADIEYYKALLDAKEKENEDLQTEIRRLELNIHEKFDQDIETKKRLYLEIENLRLQIERLQSENNSYADQVGNLEEAIKKQREDQVKALQQKVDNPLENNMPLRPDDMDIFDEYFVYNLNNIGFDDSSDEFDSFVEYIEMNIFLGHPILIKHAPGINLSNCIANTIYGHPKAAILPYSRGIGINDIKFFLSSTAERVVCLDGFIGTCNEIEMIPLLEQYRNKIIFVTYMYDRTLNYVPADILAYFRYINADGIRALLKVKDVTEDPSEIVETAYMFKDEALGENRYKKIFSEIATECDINADIIGVMTTDMDNEEKMNNVLLYTLLPYITNVMHKNPYICSKRLQRYAGESGKCPKKDLMIRWFG